MELLEKILASTLNSHPLTHSRLKHLSSRAQCTEDIISRVGFALSIRRGPVPIEWAPSPIDGEDLERLDIKEKLLKGKTLFKDELALWMALILRNQVPDGYPSWRKVIIAHWERGIEELSEISDREGDWIRTVQCCLPS